MEEMMWEDIDDLVFYHHSPNINPGTTVNNTNDHHHHRDTSLLDLPKDATPHQIPLTSLSLGLGFTHSHIQPNLPVNENSTNNKKPTVGTVGLPSSSTQKPHPMKSETSEQRHKRLMKSRESSARSRLKKRAYTDNLKSAVASLMEENATLRRWLEKLLGSTPADLPIKHKLQRTSTAPF